MKKPVLVLGGGIAGIQAALDLAEMDVPVFLVESAPALGGRMAQLDKTFPTNDCSACILAPKITACYNHPLIKTFTLSDLVGLTGDAPDFTAVIRKRARFIDEEKCRGCDACVQKCPIVRKSEFDMGVGARRAVFKPYAQAVPNIVSIEKKGTPPCKSACPAHIDIAGCTALAAQGRWAEALEVIRRATVFAGVLGRVCEHPCEENCARRLVDAPVALKAIERFAADHDARQEKPSAIKPPKDRRAEKVAVVGAGPTGLSCAYQLARAGYPVTVFEAKGEAGGALRGIPGISETLDREIGLLGQLGVEIRLNAAVENAEGLLANGYAAALWATGAHSGYIPGVPGAFAVGMPGPASLVEAIAEGNRAAVRIRNFVEGTDLPVVPHGMPETPVEQIDFSQATPDARMQAPDGADPTEEEIRREAARCLNCSVCCECGLCEKACGFGAVCHSQTDERIELRVGSVILASGYDPANDLPDGFGYGRYQDVVTSLEYERMLSSSGPYQGHVKRPSDGREPSRIAFIQCAGSRDEQCDGGYCSAVCCMYAVKEAIITREHLPGSAAVDLYYMDMRACGKDFDRYVDLAREKYGVGFIRSRISDITRDEETGSLLVRHCDASGAAASAAYDLVVLSVGLRPNARMRALYEQAGVKAERHGFAWVGEMDAPRTSRDAVLACGAASGPKDIPETVVEASAAASEAARVAGSCPVYDEAYAQYFQKKEEAPAGDVSKQPARVGVFVCHCGQNIAGYLDVKEVARYAKTLPGVEHASDLVYACSADAQKLIAQRIKRLNLTRVVVASCSPRTHEPLFREVLAGAGLNPYLLTMTNIRDQCSWVHMDDWDGATQKAKDLVRMAVGRSIPSVQLVSGSVEVTKAVMVLGGGVSGMAAALAIADMGYRAHLVEKTGALGGNAQKLGDAASGRPVSAYVDRMIGRVNRHALIDVYLNAEIAGVEGSLGNYRTTLNAAGERVELRHGAVIIATGARESRPDGYLYGADSRVMTQLEMDTALRDGSAEVRAARNVFMIQCVGSRDAERPYCSRVCCAQAARNALALKRLNPETNVTVLYRDMRTYGFDEQIYREARQAGVRFVRYEPEFPPEVVAQENGALSIRFRDPILGAYISEPADLVALAGAIEPDRAGNKATAQLFKVPLNQDGFFLEAHAKLRPVDFATEGVYVCGLAHAPKSLKESIAQGKAAAARAATVISRETLRTEGAIAEVDEKMCAGCGACERVCAYKAVSVQTVQKRGASVRLASVNPVLCKGCGTCAVACRCGAITLNGFSDRQVLGEIEALFRG